MAKVERDAIAQRLRAIMWEFGLKVPQVAELTGAGEGSVYNWIAVKPQKPSMPRPPEMARLVEKIPDLTLGYIYMGRREELKYGVAIRLQAREQGIDPDAPDFSPASVSLEA